MFSKDRGPNKLPQWTGACKAMQEKATSAMGALREENSKSPSSKVIKDAATADLLKPQQDANANGTKAARQALAARVSDPS